MHVNFCVERAKDKRLASKCSKEYSCSKEPYNTVCDWDRGVRTGVTRRDAPPQEFSPETDCMRRASEMKVAESMAMRVMLDK
jgi:hypothetical protein